MQQYTLLGQRVAKKDIIISLPDAKQIFTYSFFIPKIGQITFQISRPRMKPLVHRFDGQHYWEINKRNYPLKKIIDDLSNQNVIYSELFYSPWDFLPNGLSVEEITEAILSGVKQAEQDFPITCHLIVDIVRDYDHTKALDRVHQILPFRDNGVIGIGLGGNEQKYPARLFRDAFKYAGLSGFRLTAHAGEAAGPESVWEAIRDLKSERIGHGVRSVEDPELIEFLKDHQIPLEICVISNLKTKIYSSPQTHPIKYFLEKQLKVTVNSDDPAMFGATITDELLNLYDKMDVSCKEIKLMTINALESAFISKEIMAGLKQKIELFWTDYNR